MIEPVTLAAAMSNNAGAMKHIPALDGLRAFAVLIVMISHGGFGHIVPGGFGVTIFFFLSGYLITTLLRREFEKSDKIDFKGFYFRRIVRIFPPMYVAILFAVILSLLSLQPEAIKYENLYWDFLFLSNYSPGFDGNSGIRIPLWSLDVEEHFYMIFPLFYFMFASKLSSRNVALSCAAICLIVLLVRIINVAVLDDFSNNYYWSHTRIDSILFGCCLALWNNPNADGPDYFKSPWFSLIMAGVLLLAAFVIRDPVFRETLRYSIQGIGLFFLFNFIVRDNSIIKQILGSGIMRFVALLSYSLYLIHLPLFVAINMLMPEYPPMVRLAVGTALSFAFAYAIYIFVERPLAQWRRKTEAKWQLTKREANLETGQAG